MQALRELGFPSVSAAHRAYRRTMSVGQILRIKVGSRVSVSEKEVAEQYRRLYGTGQEEEVHLQQILIRVPLVVRPDVELALYHHVQSVRQAIAEGTLTFEQAARRYSESAERESGGDLGWTRKGTFQFDVHAFKLQPGEMSPVVRSFLGFHILKVTGRRRVEITSEERLKRVITQELYEARFRREMEAWYRDIKENAVIRVIELVPLFGPSDASEDAPRT